MLREQIEEFLEMVESDFEHLDKKGEAAKILKNYIADLKEILKDTENE